MDQKRRKSVDHVIGNNNFRLPFVAHERLCLSSLIERLRDREIKVTGSSFAKIIGVGQFFLGGGEGGED